MCVSTKYTWSCQHSFRNYITQCDLAKKRQTANAHSVATTHVLSFPSPCFDCECATELAQIDDHREKVLTAAALMQMSTNQTQRSDGVEALSKLRRLTLLDQWLKKNMQPFGQECVDLMRKLFSAGLVGSGIPGYAATAI